MYSCITSQVISSIVLSTKNTMSVALLPLGWIAIHTIIIQITLYNYASYCIYITEMYKWFYTRYYSASIQLFCEDFGKLLFFFTRSCRFLMFWANVSTCHWLLLHHFCFVMFSCSITGKHNLSMWLHSTLKRHTAAIQMVMAH